jgi:AraC-like DNA-binding protein
MEYLTQWRMQIACELLQEGHGGIAEVASAVGYESTSAFSVAFTRIVQCRPGHYRKRVAMGGENKVNGRSTVEDAGGMTDL